MRMVGLRPSCMENWAATVFRLATSHKTTRNMRLLHILSVSALPLLPNLASASHIPGPNRQAAMILAATKMDFYNVPEFEQQLFIETWARQAVDHMRLYGIPASVTLAQAIVESGWGKGTVAVEGNNYFCIKGNNGWTGPIIKVMDDDSVDAVLVASSFRKYETVEESFADHSRFLRENKRYQPLFKLDPYDYKGWAFGLKASGYATAEKYAEQLISTIEKHGLYVYDYAVSADQVKTLNLAFEQVEEEMAVPMHDTLVAPQIPENQGDATPQTSAGQPMLTVPAYKLDREATSVVAKPSTGLPDAGAFAKIPLILPKTTPKFKRR
jgi:Mannosyl-glycoprotein endo-beta-N-acetylglucosaminidase